MTRTAATALPSLAEAASFTPQQIIDQWQNFAQQVEALQQQVDWFKRQLFGQKSEKRVPLEISAVQGSLGQAFDSIPEVTPPAKKRWVVGH